MIRINYYSVLNRAMTWFQSRGPDRRLVVAGADWLPCAQKRAGILVNRIPLHKGSALIRRQLTAWISALFFVASPAWADWALNNELSQLSFISVKKGDIAEVHRFDQLGGSVDSDGNVELTIQLASVDTAIPIRDERMREMLFNTNVFPTATLIAKIDVYKVSKLNVSEMMVIAFEGQLSLHGHSSTVTSELLVARLAADTLLISSRKPLVLQAGDFELLEGINRLREVAKLTSISEAVPVSFVLTFNQHLPTRNTHGEGQFRTLQSNTE